MQDGFRLLVVACRSKNEATVDHLIKKKADVNATSEEVRALPCSCAASFICGRAMPLCNSHSIHPPDFPPQDNYTALSMAIALNEVPLVVLLLNNGANLEATNSSGATPLVQAAYDGHTLIVAQLLERKANIAAADDVRHV